MAYIPRPAARPAAESWTYPPSPMVAPAAVLYGDLSALNAAVDGPAGAEIVPVIAAIRGAGMEITAHGRLKTAPRGYPKDHPRIGLLCLKGLIAWRQWPAEAWLATPAAKGHLMEFFDRAQPLQDWLSAHVGDSEAGA